MKIGILTLPLHSNYGGILQAWALQTILEKEGHEVEVLNHRRSRRSPLTMLVIWFKRALWKVLFKSSTPIFAEKIESKKTKSITDFIKQRINQRFIKNLSEIPINDYDCIIVGSDQIWRKKYVNDLWDEPDITKAFLSHIKTNKLAKISYAASLGTDAWQFTDDETLKIKNALRDYLGISVREESATRLLRNNTGQKAVHVLDPTMLLNAADYIDKFSIDTDKKGVGLVSYILNKSTENQNLINYLKSKLNLKHIELNRPETEIKLSLREWLSNIACADIVVTDSYHGCIFCLLFKKKFIFAINKDRGEARFKDLIDNFNLENNMLENLIIDLNLLKNIPEGNPYDKLNDMRKNSYNYLNGQLGKLEG